MMLKKYQQLQATIQWSPFTHNKIDHSLSHLDVHEVTYQGTNDTYTFVVTYSLHCFAKDDEPSTISVEYTDSAETRKVSMERYMASLQLRTIIEGFDQKKFGAVGAEKFFCFEAMNSASGIMENYKVCFVLFKEMRFLRMHITSAFFHRETNPQPDQKLSIYKLASDLKKSPKKTGIPKEAVRQQKGLPIITEIEVEEIENEVEVEKDK